VLGEFALVDRNQVKASRCRELELQNSLLKIVLRICALSESRKQDRERPEIGVKFFIVWDRPPRQQDHIGEKRNLWM
jgi:hypothetical protein